MNEYTITIEKIEDNYIVYRHCSHGLVPLLITKDKECANILFKGCDEK